MLLIVNPSLRVRIRMKKKATKALQRKQQRLYFWLVNEKYSSFYLNPSVGCIVGCVINSQLNGM